MEHQDIHVRVQANKAAMWFIIGFVALLGALFVLGGVAGLIKRPGADDAVMLLLGAACLFLAERLARHFMRPQLTIAADKLLVRPFWGGTVVWPYSEVKVWTVRSQRIERSWTGRRMIVPITIERLIRTDHAGAQAKVVLPGFAGRNEHLLSALATRSGVDITVA